MAAQCRALTAEEHDLLAWLLEHGEPDVRNFMPQLDVIKARSSCTCGCPSVEFTVPMEASYAETTRSIVADFTGAAKELPVVLILFATGGELSELKVFPFDSTDLPFGLPAIVSLRPFVSEASQ